MIVMTQMIIMDLMTVMTLMTTVMTLTTTVMTLMTTVMTPVPVMTQMTSVMTQMTTVMTSHINGRGVYSCTTFDFFPPPGPLKFSSLRGRSTVDFLPHIPLI